MPLWRAHCTRAYNVLALTSFRTLRIFRRRDRIAGEVASRELSRLVLDQRRYHILADRELRDRTPRVKNAAAGGIERRRNIACQKDSRLVLVGIGNRNRRE